MILFPGEWVNSMTGWAEDSSPTSRSMRSTVCEVEEIVIKLLAIATLLPVETLCVEVDEVDLVDMVRLAFCTAWDGIVKRTFGAVAKGAAAFDGRCPSSCFEAIFVAADATFCCIALPSCFEAVFVAVGATFCRMEVLS